MTDPDTADATYVEPLTLEVLAKILEREKPSAVLPNLGRPDGAQPCSSREPSPACSSSTALSSSALRSTASRPPRTAISSRRRWPISALKCTPQSAYVSTLEEAREAVLDIGYPAILRPSFTMGGAGAAIAYTPREFDRLVLWGLDGRAHAIRSSSNSRSSAGRNTSSKSCVTTKTTWSSCVRSKISTPWASTPVTRSPWLPR